MVLCTEKAKLPAHFGTAMSSSSSAATPPQKRGKRTLFSVFDLDVEGISTMQSLSSDVKNAASACNIVEREKLPSRQLECRLCSVKFAGKLEHREHFKSDWHVHNLRGRRSGRAPITLDEYRLSASGGGQQDISSDDSDSDDYENDADDYAKTAPAKYPGRVPFMDKRNESEVYHVWKCIVDGDEPNFTLPSHSFRWLIVLYTSGRFAAGIFDNGTPIQTKTFARYTTRRKQGGSQAKHDGGKGGAGKAKSAGASMRRRNEAELHKEVHELLKSWTSSGLIESCSRVFVSASKRNRPFLFQVKAKGANPHIWCTKKSPKLRYVPFAVQRPTTEELTRTAEKLGSIIVERLGDIAGDTSPPASFICCYCC